MINLDKNTVDGFGFEWTHFDQSALTDAEVESLFAAYFDLFPWDALPKNAAGFDLGCGSGRWARQVAPRVGTLHCIDASAAAVAAAKKTLAARDNCVFHVASVDRMPLDDASMDFGYSLGVLHHIPDTRAGLHACVQKLKPGSPFLVYLYYNLDNRPAWFRLVWRLSNLLRQVVSRWPPAMKVGVSLVLATVVYWPLARAAFLL